jgi:hypothetical protein
MNLTIRRLGVALPVAATTLALALAGSSSAAAGAARHTSYPHRLTATITGFKQVDQPPSGDSMGDEAIDTFTLTHNSTKVGSGFQVCVLAATDGHAMCSASVTLPSGHLTLAGGVDGSRITRMPVVGGNGHYRRAGGVLVFTPHGEAVTINLHLTGVQ